METLDPSLLSTRILSLLLLLLLAPKMPLAAAAAAARSPAGSTEPPNQLVSFLVDLQPEALRTYGHTKFDPKFYVDLPLKRPLHLAAAALVGLPRVNGSIPRSDLDRFIHEYFGEPGSDLVPSEPPDFVPEPDGFLPKVENPEVRAWALEVHSLWRNLSRRVSDDVKENPDLHTLLPLPEPVVVPGSRFKEVYYWDSYWTIRGLLVSKMNDTAKSIVRNLVSLIHDYGHVLNAARVYYMNRRNASDMTTFATTSIIPVDLNVYIYKMELDISFFAKLIGDKCTSEKFLAASKARLKAMRSVFWNDEMGQWLDYWLIGQNSCEEVHRWNPQNQNRKIYASNFIPLWIQENGSDVETVLKSLQTSGLLHAAGIATSLVKSGQQWDFPNGWPPLQHMIAEGLVRSNSLKAKSLAEDIAVRWLRTNYVAYKKTNATMHEKYGVEACGNVGGGGEYVTQTGFGWSNGVVLAFLEEFGWPADRDIGCH